MIASVRQSHRWRVAMLVGVALALGTAAGSAQTRDSAGVRLTTIALGGHTGRITLAARPSVDIGENASDSNYEFNRVRGAVRLHDGTIVVANGGSAQLRFFDPQGRFVRSAGRKGSGPGEFLSPTRTWLLRGDTILVFDAQAQRIVLFGRDGKHLATQPLTQGTLKRQPTILAALSDHTLIAGSSDVETVPPRPEPYYFTQHLFTFGVDGKPGKLIGAFGQGEHFVQRLPPQNGGIAFWSLAFGRQTTVAAWGNSFLSGDGSTFELRAFNKSGALQQVLRADVPREPVTQADRSAFREADLRGLSGSDLAIEQKMCDEMPYPKMFPMYQKFIVGDDGSIWVQRYPHPTDVEQRWVVLDRGGRFVDEVKLPPRFSLSNAGPQYALGVYRDGDDVEHVREYRLTVR